MNNHVNPLMSYAEMCVPFPDPDSMWWAPTAEDWKREYQKHAQFISDNTWTLLDTVRMAMSETHSSQADLSLRCCHYTLYGFWGMVWELLQLYEMATSDSDAAAFTLHTGSSLIISLRRENLTKCLNILRLRLDTLAADPKIPTTEPMLVLEYLNMVLLVPLRGLQAFAGRDGEQEARRVYPSIQEWTQTREARQAIWHAGQVYKMASVLSQRRLRGTCVLLIYQASITVWVYGIMARARRLRDYSSSLCVRDIDHNALIWLDGEDITAVRRFVATAEGVTALGHVDSELGSLLSSTDERLPCLIEDASGSMKLGISTLRRSHRWAEAQHAIVGSIIRLMHELAKVADIL